ncbi:SIS domain-containing protein [Aureimonas sp. Leaf454]|uniref:SIS domain-containing protein n=1 Tax=Aureimonas sp. Leaf454 TaxID=1736381 RepID=UPI000AFC5726|nr:SIS domain-containing protein [Aureimonas sp. Leaf454]
MSQTAAVTAPFPPHAEEIATAMATALDYPAMAAEVDRTVAAALAHPAIAGARRIFLAGSGDSYFAALSAAPALARWTGLPVQATTAMDLARYQIPVMGEGDLVVSISNSGSSSRARECVALAKSQGLATLGVTGTLEGQLAKTADAVIHRPVGAIADIPERYGRCYLNFAEYVAVLQALYVFGIELGAKRGTLDAGRAAGLRADLEAAVAGLPQAAAKIDATARTVAAEIVGVDTVFAIGVGPSRGTAAYSAAKFHEQMPINGVHQDLEEWAHLEYFLTYFNWRERSVALVIAPPGNSADRAREIVEGMNGAGGRALLVAPASAAVEGAFAHFEMPEGVDDFLSPMVYHLPAQLLVLYMAHLSGIQNIPLRRTDGFRLIAASAIRDDVATLR